MISQNTKHEILDQYRISQTQNESYNDIEINDNMTLTFEVADNSVSLVLSIETPNQYYDTLGQFQNSIKGKNPKIDRIVSELSDIVGVELDFYCEPYETTDKHYWVSHTFY